MPILIGEPLGSDFGNPLGLLTDCHRRIEHFLNVLLVVAGQEQMLDDEHRRALEVALRYFRESAPKHMADEEESLFPRILSHVHADADSISIVLKTLNSDHRSLDERHRRVDELCRWWLASGFLRPEELTRLKSILWEIREIYSRHIAIEEAEVFPFAIRVLPNEELQGIAFELAQRRGLTAMRRS